MQSSNPMQSSNQGRRTRLAAAIGGVIAAVLFLSGCASGTQDIETSETTLQSSHNGVDVTITFTATGDDITLQVTESVLTYETLGVADADEAREMIDPTASIMQDANSVNGVEHSLVYGEDATIETVIVDYTVVDLADLAQATGAIGDSADTVPLLSEQVEYLEASGFEIVE